jgi:hypothetical protein
MDPLFSPAPVVEEPQKNNATITTLDTVCVSDA